MLRLNNRDATRRRIRKLHLQDATTCRGNNFLALQSINSLLDAMSHCSLRCLCSETINDGLQSVDFFGLQRSLLNHALFIFGTRTSVLAIGAFVFKNVAGGIFGITV